MGNVGVVEKKIEEMIEELHVEVRQPLSNEDARLCLAKRNALSELLLRVRGKAADPYWAKLRPQVG